MDWSPDATIATGHLSGAVAIRDQYTLAVRREVRTADERIAGQLAFSPTGGMLAVGLDSAKLEVHDLNKGGTVTFQLPDVAFALAWAPEGRRMAVDCIEKVVIYDVWARVKMMEIPVVADAMAWSADGKQLAIADDEGIKFWAIPPDHLAVPKGSGG